MGMIFYAWPKRNPQRLRRDYGRRIGPILLFLFCAALSVYFILPKTTSGDVHTFQSRYWESRLGKAFYNKLAENPAILMRSEEEIRVFLQPVYQGDVRGLGTNHYTGEAMRLEDSPGNFTIEPRPEGARIWFYRMDGSAILIHLPDRT